MYFRIAFLLASCHFFVLVPAQKRGFGGNDVSIRQYPFVVAIVRDDKVWGSGAILTPKWILTTYSTFREPPLDGYAVNVGADAVGSGEYFQVQMIYQHPEYDRFTNNIALVKLYKEINFGLTAQPIKLMDTDPDYLRDVLMLSYGTNEAGSRHLRATTYSLTAGPICKVGLPNTDGYKAIDWRQAYCQNAPDGDKGQWLDDSGAPIIYNDRLVALHGYRVENYTDNYNRVAIAVRLYSFKAFIENTMKL